MVKNDISLSLFLLFVFSSVASTIHTHPRILEKFWQKKEGKKKRGDPGEYSHCTPPDSVFF